MQTNKILLPSFIDDKATGTISVNLEFEQGATINYNIHAKKNESISSGLFELGTRSFTALGYKFKLQNSNLNIDPLSSEKMLSVSFKAVEKDGVITTNTDEDKDKNPFEVERIGIGGASISSTDIIKFEVNYAADDTDDFEFTPSFLTWGETEYDDSDDGNPYTNFPIYEPIQYTETIVVNDPEDASNPPYTGRVTDFSMNYDSSGETRTREVNYYEGTILKKKEVRIYGFVYYSTDVGDTFVDEANNDYYGMKGSSLGAYWRLVEYFTINYNYEDGYYLGYDKIGAKLLRFAQESDSYEILSLEFDGDYSSARAFKFQWSPIIEYERLELHAYYMYYRDAKVTFDDQYFWVQGWSTELNKWLWTKLTKKDYVLPRFVKKQINYTRCMRYTFLDDEHYLNDPYEKNKFIMTGQEQKTVMVVNINRSDSTETRQFYAGNGAEDSYEVLTETMSAQDDGFKNYVKRTTSDSNFGRPGQADYYPLFQQSEVEQDLNADQPVSPINYVVKKIGTNDSPKSSINIPEAKSVNDAFEKLKQQLRKSMLFNGDQFVVTCLYAPNIKPNNVLNVSYNNRGYRGIVKSVTHNIEILGKNIGKGFTTVTVAVENKKNGMWKKIQLSQDNNNNDNPPESPNVEQPGPAVLGEVNDIITLIQVLPSRGTIS